MRSVDSLPFLDIESEAYRADPQAVLAELRSESWAARSTRGVEVLRHEQANQLLRDRRLYWPMIRMMAEAGVTDGPIYDFRSRVLIARNGADHARMRRLALLGFNRNAVEALRERVRDLARQLLDDAEASGSARQLDFMAVVAEVLPPQLFCLIVGSPLDDAPKLAEISMGFGLIEHMEPRFKAEIENAILSLSAYVAEQIERRRDEPGADLLSVLLGIEADGDRLAPDELIVLLMNILQASTDTTSSQLALTIATLCDHPGAWGDVVADPAKAGRAVEEGLRYAPRQVVTLRMSDEDVPVDVDGESHVVPAGTLVAISGAAANRDPRAFPDPDRFDIDRVNSRAQLTFGAGAHGCLGQMLARMEMEEIVREMATRYRTLRRVDTGRPLCEPLQGVAHKIDTLVIEVAR